mmetsp:Transcript_7243/g.11424  ORF Transcript_7243/g.11424 Transcript_7243/m.11424 type:complete len:132 (+) Transcript_7243:121-516(+)
MSSKSVRKLLRRANLEEGGSQKSRLLKRKRKENSEQNPELMNDNALLQKNIESLLTLDRALEGKEERGKFILRARKKSKVTTYVGNSRSSFAQAKNSKHEPTFNKRQYEEEKKKKTLEKVAKLLRKTKKKL